MKAVIIGSNGYIGKHLAVYMQQRQYEVFAYDLSAQSAIPEICYKQIDLCDKLQIEKINTDVDFIFYFAGITGTLRAYDDYEKYINVNETGLLNLLNLIRQRDSKARVIFPSTRLVYKGQENISLSEEAPKEFKTVYALNKWFGEQILEQYWNYFGIPYTIFRICVPYGNMFPDGYSYGTVGFFLNQANKKENIRLFGSGNQKRTFTHVEDICRQILETTANPASSNQVFNIGGEPFSLNDVAQEIAVKHGIRVEHTDWPELDLKVESGDTIFDDKKIRQFVKELNIHHLKEWLNTVK